VVNQSCPGCGMATRPLVDVVPRPIPATGNVLFVLALPHELDDEDVAEGMVLTAHELASDLAPGRAGVIALEPGVTLDMLTDDELASVGLQRRPRPE
jgi:hypothetical protein